MHRRLSIIGGLVPGLPPKYMPMTPAYDFPQPAHLCHQQSSFNPLSQAPTPALDAPNYVSLYLQTRIQQCRPIQQWSSHSSDVSHRRIQRQQTDVYIHMHGAKESPAYTLWWKVQRGYRSGEVKIIPVHHSLRSE